MVNIIKREYGVEDVEDNSKFLYAYLFPKKHRGEAIEDSDFKGSIIGLKHDLMILIENKNFFNADEKLRREIEASSGDSKRECLKLAVWFYIELNKLSDEDLAVDNNFSRSEIVEGLKWAEEKALSM